METVRAEICKEQGMISGIEYIPYGPSTSFGPTMATQSSPPRVSAPPTGLDKCLFFISLVLDFLAV